jgi:hypothetical protein
MSKQKLPAAAPVAALCAALAFAFAIPPAVAAGQPGMVVARDPQTGQLRAPTAAELKALRTQGAAAVAPLTEAPAPAAVTRKDGVRQLRLGENAMVYSVVTRDADGKSVNQCVHGEHATAKALSQPAAGAKHNEEHNHE